MNTNQINIRAEFNIEKGKIEEFQETDTGYEHNGRK